jgi:hypothetical protein
VTLREYLFAARPFLIAAVLVVVLGLAIVKPVAAELEEPTYMGLTLVEWSDRAFRAESQLIASEARRKRQARQLRVQGRPA